MKGERKNMTAGHGKADAKGCENKCNSDGDIYRTIVETSPNAITVTDLNLNIIECNQKTLEMHGFSRKDEIIGKNALELIAPKDRKRALENARKTLDQEIVRSLEYTFLAKDGSEFQAELSAKVILDASLNPEFFVAITRDITERKRAEGKLRETTELLLSIMNSSTEEMIIATDPQGNILAWNEGVRRLLGYEPEEVGGKKSVRIFHNPEYLKSDRMEENIKSMIATGKPLVEETTYVAKDGRSFPVQQVVTPRFDEEDKFVGMLGLVRDTSERKRAEEALCYRVEFERLITALSTTFINLATDEIDQGINDALEKIGKFADVDRSYVFLFYDNITRMNNTHEWCAEGVDKQILNCQGFLVKDFPWCAERIKRFESIHVPNVDDLPPEALEKAIFQAQEIKSLILVPMVYAGSLYGFIGFDSVRREKVWSEDVISLLRIVSEMFASALERNRAEEEIKRHRDRLEELVEERTDELRASYDQLKRKIVEQKKAEEQLLESEEKYRLLFSTVSDAILVIDAETKQILDINNAAQRIYGYTRDEFLKLHITDVSFEGEKTIHLIRKTLEGKATKVHVRYHLKKDGTRFPIEVSASLLMLRDRKVVVEVIRDITERVKREDEVRDQLLKFRLEDGNVYLALESHPGISVAAFNDLITVGYGGVVIARTPENQFKRDVPMRDVSFWWVGEKSGEKTVFPNYADIGGLVESMLPKTVVFIERLDYLLSKNTFKKTLSFVQHLRECAYLESLIVILSLDPSTLNESECALLKKETKDIESKIFEPLTEDLVEILRFIYRHNIMGLKPSYTLVGQKVGASKPTVRWRIRNLIAAGYIVESLKGNTKVVELTERGRQVLS